MTIFFLPAVGFGAYGKFFRFSAMRNGRWPCGAPFEKGREKRSGVGADKAAAAAAAEEREKGGPDFHGCQSRGCLIGLFCAFLLLTERRWNREGDRITCICPFPGPFIFSLLVRLVLPPSVQQTMLLCAQRDGRMGTGGDAVQCSMGTLLLPHTTPYCTYTAASMDHRWWHRPRATGDQDDLARLVNILFHSILASGGGRVALWTRWFCSVKEEKSLLA